MMQRLREQTSSSDKVTARAAALLSAMPPLDTNRLRPTTLPGLAARRGMGAGIRTGVVLACSLGAVAAAAATMGAWPPRRAETGSSGPAYSVPSLPSPERVSRPVAVVSEARVNRPSVADAPAPASRAILGGSAVRSLGVPSKASPAPVLAGAASSPPPSLQREALGVEDESTLIVRSVRALRREGDPTRAEELAEQALQRFPHGAQVEEATALVMEAAAARGDALGARRAAQTYLDRFRTGRFADRAQRILASAER
jgi:hypothetical protein